MDSHRPTGLELLGTLSFGDLSEGVADTVALAAQVGVKGLRESHQERSPYLPRLVDYHRAWKDGRLSIAELRASLVWLWLAIGRSQDETIARELFEACGYVTDSPMVKLPRSFRIYQGRALGEPPGMAWSPDPELAREYAQRSVAGWLKSGRVVEPGFYTGTVDRRNLLLFSRTSCEVVVLPHLVRSIKPWIAKNAAPAPNVNIELSPFEIMPMYWRIVAEVCQLVQLHPDIVGGSPPPPDVASGRSSRQTRVHPVDWPKVLDGVKELAQNAGSPIHGDTHWRRVATLGLDLAATDPAIDPEIVVLFGMIHDALRFNEGRDMDHGVRAATYAIHLDMGLEPDRFDTLRTALRQHSLGTVSDDPTIGACWDADRLDLYRLGRTPDDDLLSTSAARRQETRQRAISLLRTEPPTWAAIFLRASDAG